MILLAGELTLFDVPARTLKVKALQVAPVLWFFLGEVRVAILGDHGVKSRLVECPTFDPA